MSRTPIDQLRAICLALPEAEERATWDDATFRVRDKIAGMVKQGDGRVSFWCPATAGAGRSPGRARSCSTPARWIRPSRGRPPGADAAGWPGGADPRRAQRE